MTSLANIVAKFGPAYLDRFGEDILPSHRQALTAITACHTGELGGHWFVCQDCGVEQLQAHSCRNRACPACGEAARRDWIAGRLADLLPVPYFHLVITVPACLRDIIRSHQQLLLGALQRIGAASLMKLARDRRYVGGQIGVLSVLHTWDSTLGYHPHVHCLIPGGGFDSRTGLWRPSRRRFLVPIRALSDLFRGMFLDELRSVLPEVEVPAEVFRHRWVSYARRVKGNPERVITYLGRYIHRTAISNSRILGSTSVGVTFAPKGRTKPMTLAPMEFLRRFLQHVLPRGFHRVRHYGFLNPSNKAILRRIQLVLWRARGGSPPSPPAKTPTVLKCRSCGSERLAFLGRSLPTRGGGGGLATDPPIN